ncbi:ebs-bah-phd domain-containing protein [Pyrenophora tritici-repentis]|nr:ebs-bah-phd domain-containing protein [Pyrenophora tritici-repentis]
MARKRKASDDAPVHAHTTPPTDNKFATTKKQKIEWDKVDNFEGFTISSVGLNAPKQGKKSKRNYGAYPGQDAPLDAEVVQPNPFPDTDLSEVHVKISPAIYWENTSRYRKFTINNEEFSVGQIVFVKKVEDEQDAPDAIQHWLAKVLEIRAGDASHVYLRVFWAYRPEDLPGGRQPHHGSCELIISNHMDIIEALTVQAAASVIYWNDDPDDLALPADQLFYRQSFDVTKKIRPLSKLNTFCIDKKPCNPDKILVQCPHCSNWLHAECLEKEAVQTVPNTQNSTPMPPPKKRGRPSKGTQADVDPLEAELHSSDTGKTRLTITDNREGQNKRQWDVDIPCLMCGKIIEEADPSTGADNAVKLEAEPEPQKEEDADDANTTPPLAPSEADSVLRDSDADATAPTTTKPSTAPDLLPPPAAPIEIKGETASSTSPPSD